MTTINAFGIAADKLAEFEALELHSGKHRTFSDGHCSMEVVSWLADEGFTDAPACASPVITRYVIRLNDRWGHEKRQALKPYLLRMIGTGGDGKDSIREQIAAEWVSRRLLGPWLRLAGLDAEADHLERAATVDEVRTAVRAARDAAWALRLNRRKLIEQKVRERLAEQGKPAVAVAVADADAVADAVAAADAGQDVDWWGKPYSAAYKAARAYYDANPLPIAQEIADLAASQQDVALELLDALIEAKADQ